MDQPDANNQEAEQEANVSDHEGDVTPKESAAGDLLPDAPEVLKQLVRDREETIERLRLRNVELQRKLDEREQVVQALTSRLEQAAEQLDRIKRSGGSSGRVLAGIPAEVIEEQRELINDLKSAIQHWEDLQSTSAMGRFEAQLLELREMLEEQLKIKSRLDKGLPASSGGSSSPAAKSKSSGQAPSSWEQMKAQLMGNDVAKESAASSDVTVPGGPAASESSHEEMPASRKPYDGPLFQIEIEPRPESIASLESADQQTLVEAVKNRDRHIDHLMSVIETLKREAGVHDKEAMLQRQKELEEKLRQAEIEMSMERAKLAREASQLKQREEELANPNARNKKNEESTGGDGEKGNRWVRFLGSK